jgi:hypothetical protein
MLHKYTVETSADTSAQYAMLYANCTSPMNHLLIAVDTLPQPAVAYHNMEMLQW